jgi:hypothetical protein
MMVFFGVRKVTDVRLVSSGIAREQGTGLVIKKWRGLPGLAAHQRVAYGPGRADGGMGCVKAAV